MILLLLVISIGERFLLLPRRQPAAVTHAIVGMVKVAARDDMVICFAKGTEKYATGVRANVLKCRGA